MTTPHSSPPGGAYIIGSTYGSDLTEESAKAIMKGGTVGSFSNAQNAHASQVRIPLQAQSVTVSNHENRITILESGEQIAEFNSNDTWTKPPGTWHHHTLIGIAGGGSGWSTNTEIARNGGGQGGYSEATVLDGDMPGTAAIVIGAGGAASGSLDVYGQQGGNTTIGGSLLVVPGGPGGTSATTNPGAGTHPEWAANGGRGGLNNTAGGSGGNGFQAQGGVGGGPGGNGSPGADCPLGSIGPGAGGGGGGGGNGGVSGGRAAAGGFPGGGGGSGGVRGSIVTTAGLGANGGNGRAWIVSSPGV